MADTDVSASGYQSILRSKTVPPPCWSTLSNSYACLTANRIAASAAQSKQSATALNIVVKNRLLRCHRLWDNLNSQWPVTVEGKLSHKVKICSKMLGHMNV